MTSYNNWCYGYTMDPNFHGGGGANAGANGGANGGGQNYSVYEQSNQVYNNQEKASLPPNMNVTTSQSACARLHNFALQNNLWESYSTVSQSAGYVVSLSLGNEQFLGNGTTLKEAKEAAAARALRETTYIGNSTSKSANSGTTATSQLHEIATKKGVNVEFKFIEPYNFKFKSSMRTWAKSDILSNYKVHLKVASYDFFGQADHPQRAKHIAASEALPYVQALPDIPKAKTTVTEGMLQGKNVIMALNEISMTNGLCPEWTMVGDQGLPHQRTFTWSLKLGDHEAVGTGSSKKVAKTNAAQQMLSIIPDEWKKAVLEVDGRKKKKGKKRKSAGALSLSSNIEDGEETPVSELKRSQEDEPPLSKRANVMPVEFVAGSGSQVDDTTPRSFESNCNNGQLDSEIPIYQEITSSNPISCLYEFCKKAKINDPLFECVNENVIDTWQKGKQTLKKTEYTMKLIVKDKTYYDSGSNKRLAKNNVATKAWNNIRAGID